MSNVSVNSAGAPMTRPAVAVEFHFGFAGAFVRATSQPFRYATKPSSLRTFSRKVSSDASARSNGTRT